MKILLVDDDDGVRRVLYRTLDRHFTAEADILVAGNGDEGLRLALDKRPDIIVTDVQMPGKTGTEMVAEIWKKLEEETPPVVFVTSEDEERVKRHVPQGVKYTILPKPAFVSTLVTVIQHLME